MTYSISTAKISLAAFLLTVLACTTTPGVNAPPISEAAITTIENDPPDLPSEPVSSAEAGNASAEETQIIGGGVRVEPKKGLLVEIAGRWNPAAFTAEQLNQSGMLCIRHNNYWCIKAVGWEGEIGSDDRSHAIFSDAKFGARAFFRLMRNYRFRHNLKTTREIFSRYAPFTDCIGSLPRDPQTGECPNGPNPTLEYATKVAESLDVGIDDDIGLFDNNERINRAKAHTLARAVARFELGSRFNVTEELLDEGIQLAGLSVQADSTVNR